MRRAERGRFITLEGAEGVGKSTNMAFIGDYLSAHGKVVLRTREPGGTATAERIREVLLQSEVGAMTDRCELLLMFAARADHVEQVIRPALERGDWVLCDRFSDATWAYQGGGRGMDARDIAVLEKLVLRGLEPDLTILLDAAPEIALTRRVERGVADRFEAEQADFFERVRRVYLERAERNPRRIRLVDASGTLADVQSGLAKIIDEFFKIHL